MPQFAQLDSMIAELYGKSMLSFVETITLSSKLTVSPHTPMSNERVPVAPHPCQRLVLSVFWILTILVGV